VEKYLNDSHTNPQTLEELQAFGDTLETGDILIMHCTHQFGKIAQLGTGSVWDHVAMVVRLPTDNEQAMKSRLELIQKSPQPVSKTMAWPQPGETGPVEVFEAMGGGAFSYPFTAHAICRGKFLKYTAVRRLRHSKTGEPLTRAQQQKIHEFVQEYWARPYEEGNSGMLELMRPIFRRHPHKKLHKIRDKNQEALDNLFCSELIAEALQAANILPEDTLNSNEILPCHFGPNQSVDRYLAVQDHGYQLGEVEVFKAPKTPLSEAIMDRREKLQSKIEEKTGKPIAEVVEEGMKPN